MAAVEVAVAGFVVALVVVVHGAGFAVVAAAGFEVGVVVAHLVVVAAVPAVEDVALGVVADLGACLVVAGFVAGWVVPVLGYGFGYHHPCLSDPGGR